MQKQLEVKNERRCMTMSCKGGKKSGSKGKGGKGGK